jgi:hypothetical protein
MHDLSLDAESGPTSLVLRNIPKDLTRTMLLSILNANSAQYDFVYLPLEFDKPGNLGFVNMITYHEAFRMKAHFDGFSSWGVRTTDTCEAEWSTSQGIAQHIEHYRNSRVMHERVPDEFKPVLFRNGERVAFPPPTRRISALRQFSGKKKL